MRILFIGCVESSFKLLDTLVRYNKNVVGVLTKEFSNYNSDYCDLTPLCKQASIPYYYVKNVNDVTCIKIVKNLSPDVCFCFGWSQLLSQDFIDLFPNGVIGYHPSKLPYNRGRHPIIWALALGLEETASTFFLINSKADEGDIISQKIVKINYEDNARTLYDKLLYVAIKQEIEIVELLENRKLQPIPQDLSKGNIWRKRVKNDGLVDWRMSSRAVYNLVRALARPYVGAHFIFKGNEIKLWKVEEVHSEKYKNAEPGKILNKYSDGSLDIKVSDGIIKLLEFDDFDLRKEEYLL